MDVRRSAGSLAALLMLSHTAWAAEKAPTEPTVIAELGEKTETLLDAIASGGLDAGRVVLDGLFERLAPKKDGASAPKFRKVGGGGCDDWGGATGCPPNLPDFQLPRREPRQDPPKDPPRREPDPQPEPPARRDPPLQKPPTEQPTRQPRREPPPPTRRDA